MNAYYRNDSQKRLWKRYIEPGYAALGKVLSTDAGKTIFYLMADAYRSADNLREVWDNVHRSHATRAEQRAEADYRQTHGLLSAYRRSLAYMMNDQGFDSTSATNIINGELYEYIGR